MERRIIVFLIIVAVTASLVLLILSVEENREEEKSFEAKESNTLVVNISDEEIIDECTEEWEEYNEEVQFAFEQANNRIPEDDNHYLLKTDNGYISVYIIDNQNEILYKKTNIAVDYLSDEDIEELNEGIEVVGIEEVNKRLEDYE